MESVEYKRLRDLIEKYREDRLAGEDIKELISFLGNKETMSALQNINLEELEKISESDFNGEEADYDEVFKNIASGIERKKNSETENITSLRREKIWRLSIQIASAAAVLAVVFLLTRNLFFNPAGTIVTANEKSVNEVSTPFGAISRIRLTDGSEIILNAGSFLRYNNAYGHTNRDVYLEGEAYFKVRSDSSLPFNVNTGSLLIQARGTTFNVKAYADEKTIETTLIEGRVALVAEGKNEKSLETYLVPNQKAIFLKDSRTVNFSDVLDSESGTSTGSSVGDKKLIVSPSVDTRQITSWINNELIIKNERLESLTVKLHRKYDLDFVFNDNEVKDFRFTGLLMDEPVEQVLHALSLSAPVNYHVEGKKVYLSTRY